MKYTYVFRIYYDILEEAGIDPISGLEVDPVFFEESALTKSGNRLTEKQINIIINKLVTFYKNKFNLTSAKVVLDKTIKAE